MEKEKIKEEVSADLTEQEGCKRTISIEVSAERFEKEKDRIAKDLRKTVSLPGFRKGKVPYEIIRRHFSEEIKAEAIKKVVPEAYQFALEKWELKPVGDPVFSEIEGGDNSALRFKVDIEVMPEFELKDYTGIDVQEEEIEVSEEELDQVIERLREQQATLAVVERPAKEADLVVVDYVPLGEDGTPEEDKKVKDYPILIGAGEVFPVFEQALVGKSKGETGEVEIEYPQDYKPEHLAGKKIRYSFTVKEVKEKVLPELNEEFVSKVNPELKSVEELSEDIKNNLLEEKSKEAERKKQAEAIDKIIESNKFDIPRAMVEMYKQRLYEEDERRRSSYGLGLEEDEEKKKELDEVFEKIAEREIRRYFIIEKIAEQEKIEVTDQDVEEEIERLVKASPNAEKQIREYFKKGSDNYSRLKDSIKEKKVFEVILG